jgi:hypothetical protein
MAARSLYLHPVDQAMTIGVLRGQTQLSVIVPVTVYHEKIDDLADVPDLQQTFISELSMFVSDVDDKVKPLLHGDTDDSGVVVIAQAAGQSVVDTGVQSGDIIRAINRKPLQSVSQLQATVRQLKSGDPVVLQVERGGQLQFLAFELDLTFSHEPIACLDPCSATLWCRCATVWSGHCFRRTGGCGRTSSAALQLATPVYLVLIRCYCDYSLVRRNRTGFTGGRALLFHVELLLKPRQSRQSSVGFLPHFLWGLWVFRELV